MRLRAPRSAAGWVAAVVYLAFAGYVYYDALHCSGWACDLGALVAFLPSGAMFIVLLRWLDPVYVFPYSWTHMTYRVWVFAVPAVLMNSGMCYWIGLLAARLFQKIARREPAR
jgi:hypothetical protein